MTNLGLTDAEALEAQIYVFELPVVSKDESDDQGDSSITSTSTSSSSSESNEGQDEEGSIPQFSFGMSDLLALQQGDDELELSGLDGLDVEISSVSLLDLLSGETRQALAQQIAAAFAQQADDEKQEHVFSITSDGHAKYIPPERKAEESESDSTTKKSTTASPQLQAF